MKSKGGIEPVFCIFYMFKDRGMSMGTGIGLTDADKLHAFLEVFVDKAMDLDDSGKIELFGDHDEMEMLRQILYVSIITSVNSDDEDFYERERFLKITES